MIFDIPGRRLDTAGPIYVELSTGEVRVLEDIQGPIEGFLDKFDEFAKRMRVFVHPSAMDKIRKETLIDKRPEILKLLELSLPDQTVSQVR